MEQIILFSTIASTGVRFGLSFWYFWIAIGCTVLLGINLLFGGHDHDADADHSADADASADQSSDHDSGSSSLSFFSFRTVLLFALGYCSGGFLGARADLGVPGSTATGIITGLALAGIGFWLMNFLYKNQSSSTIRVADLVGCTGIVETTIDRDGIGRVTVNLKNGQTQTFMARTSLERALKLGDEVKVRASLDSVLLVDPVSTR